MKTKTSFFVVILMAMLSLVQMTATANHFDDSPAQQEQIVSASQGDVVTITSGVLAEITREFSNDLKAEFQHLYPIVYSGDLEVSTVPLFYTSMEEINNTNTQQKKFTRVDRKQRVSKEDRRQTRVLVRSLHKMSRPRYLANSF